MFNYCLLDYFTLTQDGVLRQSISLLLNRRAYSPIMEANVGFEPTVL